MHSLHGRLYAEFCILFLLQLFCLIFADIIIAASFAASDRRLHLRLWAPSRPLHLFATFLLLFEEIFLIDVIASQLPRGHNQQQATNNQTPINRTGCNRQPDTGNANAQKNRQSRAVGIGMPYFLGALVSKNVQYYHSSVIHCCGIVGMV